MKACPFPSNGGNPDARRALNRAHFCIHLVRQRSTSQAHSIDTYHNQLQFHLTGLIRGRIANVGDGAEPASSSLGPLRPPQGLPLDDGAAVAVEWYLHLEFRQDPKCHWAFHPSSESIWLDHLSYPCFSTAFSAFAGRLLRIDVGFIGLRTSALVFIHV